MRLFDMILDVFLRSLMMKKNIRQIETHIFDSDKTNY